MSVTPTLTPNEIGRRSSLAFDWRSTRSSAISLSTTLLLLLPLSRFHCGFFAALHHETRPEHEVHVALLRYEGCLSYEDGNWIFTLFRAFTESIMHMLDQHQDERKMVPLGCRARASDLTSEHHYCPGQWIPAYELFGQDNPLTP